MRVSALLCCVAGMMASSVLAFEQPAVYELKPNDRVIILGDSTTADGVQSAGHVRLVEQAQHEQIPDQGVVVWGVGHPMQTSVALVGDRGYVNNVVKPLLGKDGAPTVAIINLGLNDSKSGTNALASYSENLRWAVTQLRSLKVTPMLCTPTAWRGLNQTKGYADVARQVAAELKAPLIDLYAAHADAIVGGAKPTRDGTHLNGLGETLSASAILRAFGLKPEWQKYQLRVAIHLRGKGKITVTPDQQTFGPGTKVTLNVEPEAGFVFNGWAIDAEGKEKTLMITMDRHRIILADVQAAKP